jgi:hypothetical protein
MKLGRKQLTTALIFLALTAWGGAFMSFFPAAQIETAALSQPHHRFGAYTQPIEVKGTIRYITPEQERRHDLFHTLTLCGWIVGLLAGLALWRLEKADATRT